jgi:CxxC motif-containing protein
MSVKKELTCVRCPNGCNIVVELDENGKILVDAEGKLAIEKEVACKMGDEWAEQEIENPMRTIASSIPVENGDWLMVSVRTSQPIPLAKIFAVMDEIRKKTLKAPVTINDVIIANPAGCDTDIIATRDVAKAS